MAFQLLPLLLRFPWKWFPHKVHACYKNIFSTVCIFETDQNSLQFNHIISLYFQSPEAIKKCHCAIPQFQNQSATSRLSSFSPRPSFPYSLPSSSDFFFLSLSYFFFFFLLLLLLLSFLLLLLLSFFLLLLLILLVHVHICQYMPLFLHTSILT